MPTPTAAEPPRQLVHVAIVRKVREGRESEFESQIAKFFGAATHEPGVSGAYLVRPVAGSAAREYGVLRSFQSEGDMRRFYDSDLYQEWQKAVRPLTEGEAQRRQLHGLEAFFRTEGAPPPAWKMAVVTWLGVNVAVYLVTRLVMPVFGLPPLGDLLVSNLFVVASLTWIFMPILTKLFGRWLQPGTT